MADRRGGVLAADLVDELVHQFTETLSFYRELVQNSIDAGANRIDVSLEHDGAKAVIRVEDDGDGMNEKIIDDYLTVLFRSTKDDDLTKIGKFGIGFVSVFAPKPDLVRVYTARDGESWRVDFKNVRRFEKYKMPGLRDGTLVELHKEMPRQDFDQLVSDSRATLKYWCRHSDTKITFRDGKDGPLEPINAPFDLEDGGGCLRYEEEGTQLVMGCAWTPKPFYGFYNRGLTLKEGEETFFPSVRFKVKSRYLEHTLTRDNVVRDDNFKKAMKIMERLADKELPGKVLAETASLAEALSKAAAAGDADGCAKLSELWGRRLPYLCALFARRWTFFKHWDRELVLPGVNGRGVSVAQARESLGAGGVLFVDRARTRVTDELDRLGRPALYHGAWAEELARALIGAASIANASSSYLFPQVLEPSRTEPALRALVDRAAAIDASAADRYKKIVPAEFAYPGSGIADEIFVVQNEAGQLSHVGERPVSTFFLLGKKRRCAVVNAGHPFVRRLSALHGSRPGLAAYLLLKTLHLHDGEVPEDKRADYCALAEKTERRLLEAALSIDAGRRPA